MLDGSGGVGLPFQDAGQFQVAPWIGRNEPKRFPQRRLRLIQPPELAQHSTDRSMRRRYPINVHRAPVVGQRRGIVAVQFVYPGSIRRQRSASRKELKRRHSAQRPVVRFPGRHEIIALEGDVGLPNGNVELRMKRRQFGSQRFQQRHALRIAARFKVDRDVTAVEARLGQVQPRHE